MTTTPEEFFAAGLMEMEPSPPSPSINLPLMPDGAGQGQLSDDNLVLSYISGLLMEEDIDDKLLGQYSDHPALLQAQQPFAQLLSSPFFNANSDNTFNRCNIEGDKDSLQGCSGDQCTVNSSFSKGVDEEGQFSKGWEEAHRFLPGDNSFGKGEQVIQIFKEISNPRGPKKRYNRDENMEEDAGRTRKPMIIREKLEEIGIREMFDEMMLHGYEPCIRDKEKLRIAMTNEKKNKTKGRSKAATNVVDLRTLVFRCAQAVATNDHMVAVELLKQIKQHASATGDATQRLAQCFAKGLEAWLVGTGMQLWKSLMAEHPIVTDFLKAYSLFMAACCFHKIALKFSILTITDAMVGKSRLHVVDYGLHYGFQWAGLIQCLANRNGGPPEVTITAISHSQPRTYPAQQTEEQGRRLSKCAKEFGLPFKFHVITKKWEEVFIEDLNKDTDEVLSVNDLLSFSSLMDETVFFDASNPRDTVLNNISRMRPCIFIQSIVNRSSGTSFMSRFRELLFYYMALFDMSDATMPRNSESRLVLEQGLLRRCALNAEKYTQWQVRNQRAGLRQLLLKPSIIKVLKDEVKKEYHKDFFISEDGQWLLQGWMGRVLFAHSTWVAEDAISE